MKIASRSITTLATVGIALAASVAAAKPADAFSISLDPSQGSTEKTGASALLNFNFFQDGNNVRLDLGIKNTTDGTKGLGATAATLVGVGFDLPTLISSFTYNAKTSAFTQLYNDAALQPYGTFDVGIRSAGSGNFSGGNPQQGLTAGQSSLVSFLFTGNSLTANKVETAFFDGFKSKALGVVGRFQQVNAGGGSDKVLGGVVQGNASAVPEPTTVFGAIVAGSALLGRKKLQRKSKA